MSVSFNFSTEVSEKSDIYVGIHSAKIWAKRYYVSTVGANKKAVQEYIRNQEVEDMMMDQLSFKEYEDPFKDYKDFDDDSPDIPADSECRVK